MSKVEINQESLLTILNKVSSNIEEERSLALERYKRQDENIESDEQFAIQSKGLCDLLKIAADRSNNLMAMGRMIAGILFKDANLQNNNNFNEDDIKAEIKKQIHEESISDDLTDFDSNEKIK